MYYSIRLISFFHPFVCLSFCVFDFVFDFFFGSFFLVVWCGVVWCRGVDVTYIHVIHHSRFIFLLIPSGVMVRIET